MARSLNETTKEVKRRFDQVAKEKTEAWLKANPRPKPDAATVAAEVESGTRGKVVVVLGVIEKAIRSLDWNHREGDEPDALAVLVTPHLREWRSAVATWESTKAATEAAILTTMQEFLDRVLLDHESAFLLLQDFKQWTP